MSRLLGVRGSAGLKAALLVLGTYRGALHRRVLAPALFWLRAK